VNRPRAADDFATIRARMEELRREQEAAHASESEGQVGPARAPIEIRTLRSRTPIFMSPFNRLRA
jgi:hypothetical protein